MAKSSQGTVIGVSTLPATTYTPIKCTVTIGMEDGETEELDVTCLEADTKEYIAGLADSGMLNLEFNVVFGDPGYVILQDANENGDLVGFEIELKKVGTETTGRLFTFEGIVKSLPWSAAVGAAITGTGTIRISGAVAETDPVIA